VVGEKSFTKEVVVEKKPMKVHQKVDGTHDFKKHVFRPPPDGSHHRARGRKDKWKKKRDPKSQGKLTHY